MTLNIDNPFKMFQELLTAANRYAASALSGDSTIDAQKELELAAVCYVRAAHQTYGAMWVELKKALGIMGGSTENEHKNMLLKIESLKIERDEAVRMHARVQADSNVTLQQRRDADHATAEAREETAQHARALELACDRAREYKSAAAQTAKTLVEMLDKVVELEDANTRLRDRNETLSGYLKALGSGDRVAQLEAENAQLRDQYNACHLVNEAFVKKLAITTALEEENALLKRRIESATINLCNMRDSLSNARSDLDYAESKLEGSVHV